MTAIFQGTDPTPLPSRHARWRPPRWLRRVWQGVVLGLALGVLTVTALVRMGFPRPVVRWVLAPVNAGDYFGQVQRLSLDWRGGLVASDVRMYRKGIVGPPFLEAREVRVLFNVLHPGQTGWGRIKSVTLREGAVRPVLMPPGISAGSLGAGTLVKAGRRVSLVLSLERFDVLGVWVEGITGSIRLDDQGGQARGLSGTVGREGQRGRIGGDCSWTWKGAAQGRLATSFDPHVVMPLCRALDARETRRFLEWFSFPAVPPSCDIVFNSTPGEAGELHVKGRFQAANFAYRGAGIAFANVEGAYDGFPGGRWLSLNPLVLVVGGRNVSGNVAVEFEARQASFEVVSSIDVPTLARIAGVGEGGLWESFRFGQGTRIYAKGTVGYEDPESSDMEASVEGPEIGVGRFIADECSFKFMMKGSTNLLADVRGKMGGGSFAGAAAFMPGAGRDDPTRYELKGELFRVDCQRLNNLLNTNSTLAAEGRLYGVLELSGAMGPGQGATAVGQGNVSLRHGLVFRLPLFGGMTDLLTKAIPGLDFALRQTDVRIPFEVLEGRIVSRDIQIEGEVLSLTAKGQCTLDGRLDVDVQVRPLKDGTVTGQALRALTYPLSRLFEFRLEGTIDKPRWSLFNLSRDGRRTAQPGKDGRP